LEGEPGDASEGIDAPVTSGGFLPPQAAGRAPDLAAAPAAQPAAPQPLPEPAQPPPQPAQPPPAWQQQPQQPPAWQQPPGWQQQPPGWQQPHPGWGYYAPEPENSPAITGFVFSISSIGLLLLTGSLSTLLSLGLGIAGIVFSRKGKRLVEDGKTRKHKDVATAGFVVGIIATILSALASIGWIVLIVVIAVDESTRNDFLDQENGDPAVLLALAAARLVGVALS
jgi:hypothetical protein